MPERSSDEPKPLFDKVHEAVAVSAGMVQGARRGFNKVMQEHPESVDDAVNLAGERLGKERVAKLGAFAVGLEAAVNRATQEPGEIQSGVEFVAETIARNRGINEGRATAVVRAAAGGWEGVQAGKAHLAAARAADAAPSGFGAEAAMNVAQSVPADAIEVPLDVDKSGTMANVVPLQTITGPTAPGVEQQFAQVA